MCTSWPFGDIVRSSTKNVIETWPKQKRVLSSSCIKFVKSCHASYTSFLHMEPQKGQTIILPIPLIALIVLSGRNFIPGLKGFNP